jgi:hypothetical protein
MLPVSLDCPYLIPEGTIKYGQSRDTGNITRRDNQVWTIQRHWQHNPKGQSSMDVIFPVSLDCPYLIVPSGYISSVSGLSRLDYPFGLYFQCLTGNITRRDNQVWTIQRHWQYGYQTTRPADNSDRDKSARKRGQVGP